MSRRKMSLPETYVVGAHPVLDKLGQHVTGIQKPLFTAAGRPVGTNPIRGNYVWEGGQVVGVISHWRSEAARRRCGNDMRKAEKKELIQVPIFRGIQGVLVSGLRQQARRAKKRSMMDRIKAAIQSRKSGGANVAQA